MSDIDFTFAVARIRALEVSLLNATVIEQLIACPTEENCLQVLAEKGWGDSDTPLEADAMLNRETEKTWNTMREMGIDMSVFDVLSYPNQFHNLKAAIKETCERENIQVFITKTVNHLVRNWKRSLQKEIFPDFRIIWQRQPRRLTRH